jgi:hypothetical protein
LVKREGDLGTKVHKSEERFKSSSNYNIKSLAAKAALPLLKGEYCTSVDFLNYKLISDFIFTPPSPARFARLLSPLIGRGKNLCFFPSFVKREGDFETKVSKSEERFKSSSDNNIKSLAAKAALPLLKGEFSAFTLIPKFKFNCFGLVKSLRVQRLILCMEAVL